MKREGSELDRRELEAVYAELDANPWPEDVGEARLLFDEMGPPVPEDIGQRAVEIGRTRARWLIPPRSDPDRAILFLHGGGYIYGSLASHGGMVAEIARAAECRALQLDYRLAPEHPFPAAIEDATESFRWLLDRGFDHEKVSLVGDSAGGGLVLATILNARKLGLAMPGAAVCISPWVDLKGTGESYETRASMDPMIDRDMVEFIAPLYLDGADPDSPLASPIRGDLRGFPPLLIQVGEREVLFSEAEALASKARSFGVEVVFEEWADMVHVWHLFCPILTAGREANRRVGDFCRERTARAKA